MLKTKGYFLFNSYMDTPEKLVVVFRAPIPHSDFALRNARVFYFFFLFERGLYFQILSLFVSPDFQVDQVFVEVGARVVPNPQRGLGAFSRPPLSQKGQFLRRRHRLDFPLFFSNFYLFSFSLFESLIGRAGSRRTSRDNWGTYNFCM